MNIEKTLDAIKIGCTVADWFSVEQHVNYDFDISLGIFFAEGRIVFFNGNRLEFKHSVTPDRIRYSYQYMRCDDVLLFRYDNVPHHPEIRTFPHHKHLPDKILEGRHVDLKDVVEEIIATIVS